MQEDCTTTNRSVQIGRSKTRSGGDGCWKIYQLRHKKTLLLQKKNNKKFSMHILRSFSDEATSRFLQKSKKSVDSTYTLLLIFVNTEENHDTNTKTWIRWLLKKKKTITATSLLFVIWSRFYFTARKQAKKLHFVCWCITLSVFIPNTYHTHNYTTALQH